MEDDEKWTDGRRICGMEVGREESCGVDEWDWRFGMEVEMSGKSQRCEDEVKAMCIGSWLWKLS